VMSEKYIEIPTSVLQVGSVTKFDVFLKGPDGYILYAAKNFAFEKKMLSGLDSVYMKTVYINEDDEGFYRDYLGENLAKFARDEKLDRDEKSKLMYDTARGVMKGLFEKEDLPKAISDVKVAAEVIMDNVLHDEKAFLSLVKASSYDYYTYTHCINVAIYSIGIGKFMGLSLDDLKALASGAALHDVGKSQIKPEVLNKQGQLDDAEFQHIKQHAEFGFDILFNTTGEMDERVLSAVRHHHEKLDGSGYPDGLSGKNISTFAKIVTIADIFDALNTKRCYKDPMSTFETLSLMKNKMGAHLDLDILKAFIMCMSGK
jgi:HD-GYP domain-containing protein (c-di-GMP phosphodiesterase class II)